MERSRNGRDFSKFAEVAGQGSTAGPTDYQLLDPNAVEFAATVYYRLQQADADGTSAYSPVQSVAFAPPVAPGIGLYPNPAPAPATVILDLTALPTGSYLVTLTDLAGRLVRQISTGGGVRCPLALHDLATGSYLLTVGGQGANGLRLVHRLNRE